MNTPRAWMLTALLCASLRAPCQGPLSVLHSGGFAMPYRALLPVFESSSGVTVSSRVAASQGSGTNTIPALLRTGLHADVVILSREGLHELQREGLVVDGSAVDLAQTPLGLAVRAGDSWPDISSVDGFKQAVLRAKTINLMSTPAVHLNKTVFASLGIAEAVAAKSDAGPLARLPLVDVVVLRPVSEILHAPGFDFVGPLPAPIQFMSVFSAAVLARSKQPEAARRLIDFLSSAPALEEARNSGMEAVAGR